MTSMNDLVIVRPMTDADRPEVARIAEEMPESFTPYGRAAILWDVARHEAAVALVGPLVVGFVVWVEMYAEIEILWLGVRPAFRQRGIGRRLVVEVERRVRHQRVIVVKTGSPDNLPECDGLQSPAVHRAIAFFTRLGYETAGTIHEYWDRANGAVLLMKPTWRRDADHEPKRKGG